MKREGSFVGWHHYKLTSIVPLLSTALYKNATRQFIIIAARWGGCVFISYSPWYSFLFLFVCLSLDLTPAEQQLLVEIRRRKTELLHEIQVQLYTIILEHTQQKEPLTTHVEWWNRHGENGMKEIGREREKGKKQDDAYYARFFFWKCEAERNKGRLRSFLCSSAWEMQCVNDRLNWIFSSAFHGRIIVYFHNNKKKNLPHSSSLTHPEKKLLCKNALLGCSHWKSRNLEMPIVFSKSLTRWPSRHSYNIDR